MEYSDCQLVRFWRYAASINSPNVLAPSFRVLQLLASLPPPFSPRTHPIPFHHHLVPSMPIPFPTVTSLSPIRSLVISTLYLRFSLQKLMVLSSSYV